MRFSRVMLGAGVLAAGAVAIMAAQQGGQQAQAPAPAVPDPVQIMVDRLDLDRYKATIKGLTQFGDRRQGTKRNRDAIDWIEAQLKSYGCTNTERITYMHPSPEAAAPRAGGAGATGGGGGRAGAQAAGAATGQAGAATAQAGAGQTGQQAAGRQGQAAAGGAQGAGAGGAGAATGQAAAGQRGAGAAQTAGGGGRGAAQPGQWNVRRNAEGGTTTFGYRGRIGGVNSDPMAQPDEKLRALNSEPAPPNNPPSERQEVFCTKIGSTRPDEMYIVGAHMDGHGWGEAANDDGSGTALVMELARIFSSPDVVTDRSIRFALWNNEETGLNGAWAYVNQRKDLQGKESPAGSGRYPEPKWLGMIQHDMMMWDHGAPRADGSVSAEQRLEADVNIEFQSNSTMAESSMKLAFAFKVAADRYNKNYPSHVGPHMTNTDSTPFMNLVPAISLRENERGTHTGAGWNPTWHQPTDVFTTFSDKDFTLGLNAAMTTLGAVAQLTGAKVK